eukprot:scaffold80023_cov57-Cyclotella_meneghiniana.AAC.1
MVLPNVAKAEGSGKARQASWGMGHVLFQSHQLSGCPVITGHNRTRPNTTGQTQPDNRTTPARTGQTLTRLNFLDEISGRLVSSSLLSFVGVISSSKSCTPSLAPRAAPPPAQFYVHFTNKKAVRPIPQPWPPTALQPSLHRPSTLSDRE